MNIGKPPALSIRGNAEPVRILVMGSRAGIQEIIDRLCVLGFSDHADWSRIQPHGERGELMAIMTKWRTYGMEK
jgi:hypothetical protein